MLDKKLKRKRRAIKTRVKIKQIGLERLCVNRTARHLYVQLISSAEVSDKVLASASTLVNDFNLKENQKGGNEEAGRVRNNLQSATKLGGQIAKKALALGISRVAFDRSGFKYHGRIKALADAAREAGLNF